jgi:hypothetical protein
MRILLRMVVDLAVVLVDQEAGQLEEARVVPVVVRVVPDLVGLRALVAVEASSPVQLQCLVYQEVGRKYSATVEEEDPTAFWPLDVDHEPSKHS